MKNKTEQEQKQVLHKLDVSCSINHDKYSETMELKKQFGNTIFKGTYHEFSNCPYKLGEMLSQLGLNVKIYDDM